MFSGFEMNPLLDVAYPVVAISNRPRTSFEPFTSKVRRGLARLMPSLALLPLIFRPLTMREPVWVITLTDRSPALR